MSGSSRVETTHNPREITKGTKGEGRETGTLRLTCPSFAFFGWVRKPNQTKTAFAVLARLFLCGSSWLVGGGFVPAGGGGGGGGVRFRRVLS